MGPIEREKERGVRLRCFSVDKREIIKPEQCLCIVLRILTTNKRSPIPAMLHVLREGIHKAAYASTEL